MVRANLFDLLSPAKPDIALLLAVVSYKPVVMQQEPQDAPPTKRRKLSTASLEGALPGAQPQTSTHRGLDRPISPPTSNRKSPGLIVSLTPTWNFDSVPKQTSASQSTESTEDEEEPVKEQYHGAETRVIPSPVQLTRIEKLSKQQNVDAVGLADLLGDPLIKECWNFNYLFDLDFVMQHFDADVRDMVKVKIIHGFWRRDDGRKIELLEMAEQYPNIQLLSAYIPDPFGTHHSKMLILFRHDDTAQVIIHTANMIHRDWANMTQAVWASPLLPLLSQKSPDKSSTPAVHPIGTGERFKVDLLCYLGAYEKRLEPLTTQLKGYDFSSIRAAFLGSAPSRQKPAAASSAVTAFGWLGLSQILSSIPVRVQGDSSRPHIVSQISSVATLGATPTWLSHFQSILSCCSKTEGVGAEAAPSPVTKASTPFTKLEIEPAKATAPKFSVVFPTPKEIRMCLDGYTAGGSIHWKIQSAQQQKQLEYMHPFLCHWGPLPKSFFTPPFSIDSSHRETHRGTAAPHIKTYIRFSSEDHKTIDWAMVTSANLSKQAWGDVVNKKDEIWIQSWETGVVVWPVLYAGSSSTVNEHAVMVPVFGSDTPVIHEEQQCVASKEKGVVVGFRMPYNVPLVPYAANEKPWCATLAYQEPDRYGRTWNGYGR